MGGWGGLAEPAHSRVSPPHACAAAAPSTHPLQPATARADLSQIVEGLPHALMQVPLKAAQGEAVISMSRVRSTSKGRSGYGYQSSKATALRVRSCLIDGEAVACSEGTSHDRRYDRTELLRAVDAARDAVEKNPRPETYRALLEAQSELQRIPTAKVVPAEPQLETV
jgi:hypothetical protein